MIAASDAQPTMDVIAHPGIQFTPGSSQVSLDAGAHDPVLDIRSSWHMSSGAPKYKDMDGIKVRALILCDFIRS